MHTMFTDGARAAATAGLGLTLALGATFVPTRAAQAQTGTITITQQHNNGAKYQAYLLFKADVSDDDQATHLAWGSENMRTIVLSFLDKNGYGAWLKEHHPADGQHDLPQNAAEYIAEQIGASPTDAGATTKPRTTAARSFANELAIALASNDASPRQVVTSGKAFTNQEGYWLFVTDDSTTEAPDEAGSAPMWIALGGSVKSLKEKSSLPTVDKRVREDSTQAWSTVADANIGQAVDYQLTGTMPENIGAFASYRYQFTDTLSSGLELVIPRGKTAKDAITVRVGDKEAAVDGKELSVGYDKGVLTVTFADLKSDHWKGFTLNRDTTVTVTYQARLTKDAVIGAAGNPNEVTLSYTDDPISGGTGRTKTPPPTKTFTYRLRLTKVDEQTGEPLPGASFAIRLAPGSEGGGAGGGFLQADGSLGSEQHPFVTGTDGTFTVTGIDAGTYTITELEAPSGYERIDDPITLTIDAKLDETARELETLTAKATGGDAADASATVRTEVDLVESSTGLVGLTATNDHQVPLPITGMEGLGGEATAGGLLASMAAAALAWRRHRLPR